MINVVKSGFYTSIQDMGRFGFREKGVPVSGVMDEPSAILANKLLNNQINDAVLEITMVGPELEFMCNTEMVVTGANLSPMLNLVPILNGKDYKIHKGDILSFDTLKSGFRAYLAVKGGFKTDIVLGSRSFYKPITPKNRLKDGDVLEIDEISDYVETHSHLKTLTNLSSKEALLVFKGPEFELFDRELIKTIFDKAFMVSKNNNRMAYQLEEGFMEHGLSILTSATFPGTVQLTPSGKLIILMKDAQTTGGYPRILQLTEEAISVLAQKKTGDTVRFILTL